MSRNKSGNCAKRRAIARSHDKDVRAYKKCHDLEPVLARHDETQARLRELAAQHEKVPWASLPYMQYHITRSAHQEEQDTLRLKPYNRQKYGMKSAKPVSNVIAEKRYKEMREKYES